MNNIPLIISLALLLAGCVNSKPEKMANWHIDFFDGFETFNDENWQDHLLWVNNESQCYVPDNQYGTREVSNGTIKLKVLKIPEKRSCKQLQQERGQTP